MAEKVMPQVNAILGGQQEPAAGRMHETFAGQGSRRAAG